MSEPGDHLPMPVPCCPQLTPCEPCDTLHINYRLPYRVVVSDQTVPVEVTLRFVLERCHGPLALGPLVYTTTLLPGEKVRLATTDRHSSFSFDSESHLSQYHRASSEESFYTAGMAHSVSNLQQVESSRKASSYSESSVSGGGGAGLDLGIFEIGGSVSGSSFDSRSVVEATRSFSQHASASHSHVSAGVRAASSVSVSSVASRTHTEGESEDHFESSSRVFSNPNMCRALTYLFHQVVKCQKVRFRLDAVVIRVDSPNAPTGAVLAAPAPLTGVQVAPQVVTSTNPKLLETERAARVAAEERTRRATSTGQVGLAGQFAFAATAISADVAAKAVEQAKKELMAARLIDREGNVTADAHSRYDWERDLVLPTPGVQVRSCLDECEACDPETKRRIQLELDRMELENKKLAREIELMDRAAEYRCCPVGEEEAEGE